jgi:hypothetical protein
MAATPVLVNRTSICGLSMQVQIATSTIQVIRSSLAAGKQVTVRLLIVSDLTKLGALLG